MVLCSIYSKVMVMDHQIYFYNIQSCIEREVLLRDIRHHWVATKVKAFIFIFLLFHNYSTTQYVHICAVEMTFLL